MAKNAQLQPGDTAPSGMCLTVDDMPVEISSTWADGPVFLTFLRHFGWIHCREWLAQLELHHEQIEDAGLKVVAVGLGEPKHALQFGDKLAPSITCITTSETDLYDTFGIGKGNLFKMISPSALKAGARAASRGHTQGKSTGDPQRMTASFIIDEEGIVRYAYYGENAGDHVDIDAMLADWAAQKNLAA